MKQFSILKIGVVVIIIVYMLMIANVKVVSSAYEQDMINVSDLTKTAFSKIKEKKIELGLDISEHESGMLGQDFSWITTTLGSKESKTTSTNPNFSALIYQYMKRSDAKPGDEVAVNFSGSFPALNIATIIALEYMGFEPVIQTSIGASTYGANNVEFTNLDMEKYLYDLGLIKHQSVFFSIGGHNDIGSDMNQDDLQVIIKRLKSYGYKLHYEEDLSVNIKSRMDYFKDSVVLVNVGGNIVSQTKSDFGYFNDYGYIEASKKRNYDGKGLIGHFLTQEKDVIHLLNIKDIALTNGFIIDPIKTVEVGQGDIYKRKVYKKEFVVSIWFIVVITLIGEVYVKRREEKNAIIKLIKT